ELAKEAVQHAPKDANFWSTLGAAYYAAGDWQNAISALEKSQELAPDQLVAHNGFMLAMAHAQRTDSKNKAHASYHRAVQWMEKHQPTDPELLQLRTEAAKVLGLPNTEGPVPKAAGESAKSAPPR